ncbi:MAG: TorD/DmsD family molecular chaperone [Puniceicoccales bacterium]
MTTKPTLPAPVAGNLCLLVARAFAQPDAFHREDPGRLQELASILPAELSSLARTLAGEWEKVIHGPDDLKRDYARLFLGPFEIAAPPYASMYLDRERKIMGETSRKVAEQYAAAGLVPPEDHPSNAPDHIALELEFLYFLTYQAVTEEDTSALGRYQDFANDHLLRWAPRHAADMLRANPHPFYQALAHLLEIPPGGQPFYTWTVDKTDEVPQ